jgi:hypothetical protein
MSRGRVPFHQRPCLRILEPSLIRYPPKTMSPDIRTFFDGTQARKGTLPPKTIRILEPSLISIGMCLTPVMYFKPFSSQQDHQAFIYQKVRSHLHSALHQILSKHAQPCIEHPLGFITTQIFQGIGMGYDDDSFFFKGFCSVKVVCVIVGYDQILYGLFSLCLYGLYKLFSQFVSAESIKDYNSIPCDDKVSVGYKTSVFWTYLFINTKNPVYSRAKLL